MINIETLKIFGKPTFVIVLFILSIVFFASNKEDLNLNENSTKYTIAVIYLAVAILFSVYFGYHKFLLAGKEKLFQIEYLSGQKNEASDSMSVISDITPSELEKIIDNLKHDTMIRIK